MPRNESKVWDRFTCIYDRFMKRDEKVYRKVIGRIALRLDPGSYVLEVATGTGVIALGLSRHYRELEAIDFSPKMIAAAKEKAWRMGISNIRFAVGDALALPYDSKIFDAVVIANTLHIMPEPERALAEIRRVLKPDGVLIAPTFIHAGTKKAAVLSRLMSVSGFRAYHRWTREGYHDFVENNDFLIAETALIPSSFSLAYVVAKPRHGADGGATMMDAH